MANILGSLAGGLGQIIGRTVFLQTNTATGIPIPLVVLDVVKNESVEYSADVSEHPVEKGPEVGDHRQKKNPIIRLKGRISNTPLDMSVAIANALAGGLAAISSSQARSNLLNSGLSQGVGIVGAALQGKAGNLAADGIAGAVDAISRTILLNTFDQEQPFTIITKRASYVDCVIERLHFPRDDSTGYSLEFEIDIKKVRIVSPFKVLKTAVDEKSISSAVPGTNLGAQSAQSVSPQLQQSVENSNITSSPGVAAKSPGFFGVA